MSQIHVFQSLKIRRRINKALVFTYCGRNTDRNNKFILVQAMFCYVSENFIFQIVYRIFVHKKSAGFLFEMLKVSALIYHTESQVCTPDVNADNLFHKPNSLCVILQLLH